MWAYECVYKCPGASPLPPSTTATGSCTPSTHPPNLKQISMEMDPGTFDGPRLHAFLHDCGVTRVSMGVQAFDAELLAACGRAHRCVGGYGWVYTKKTDDGV